MGPTGLSAAVDHYEGPSKRSSVLRGLHDSTKSASRESAFVSRILGRFLHCPFMLEQTPSGSKNKVCSDAREAEER